MPNKNPRIKFSNLLKCCIELIMREKRSDNDQSHWTNPIKAHAIKQIDNLQKPLSINLECHIWIWWQKTSYRCVSSLSSKCICISVSSSPALFVPWLLVWSGEVNLEVQFRILEYYRDFLKCYKTGWIGFFGVAAGGFHHTEGHLSG